MRKILFFLLFVIYPSFCICCRDTTEEDLALINHSDSIPSVDNKTDSTNKDSFSIDTLRIDTAMVDTAIVDTAMVDTAMADATRMNVNAKNTFDTPLFIAHRGLRIYGPENSKPAFIGAGMMGMWAIETDFRITADGIVICMHDEKIDRTTSGKGKVKDLTYTDICKYKLKKESFKGQKYNYSELNNEELQVPTMDDYFDICNQYNCIPFIELKEDNGVIDKMILSIKNHNLEGKCIISSTNINLLKKVRSKGCNERIHHIFSDVKYIDQLLSMRNAAMALNITDYNKIFTNEYNYQTYSPKNTKELVDMIHNFGIRVCFRAVDDTETAINAINLGLDYMPTNCLWNISK